MRFLSSSALARAPKLRLAASCSAAETIARSCAAPLVRHARPRSGPGHSPAGIQFPRPSRYARSSQTEVRGYWIVRIRGRWHLEDLFGLRLGLAGFGLGSGLVALVA